jgi:hypothetical protein
MSHFTVLVIGENPEDQLAPYCENIEVAPYNKEVVSDEDIQRFMNHYREEKPQDKDLPFEDMYRKYGNDWNSKNWKKGPDGKYYEVSTYNPESKWDWYCIGGRWSGFFKLKPGAKGNIGEPSVMMDKVKDKTLADQAEKSAIDFLTMYKEAEEAATKRYDMAEKLFEGTEPQKPLSSFYAENASRKKFMEAREKYYTQPRLVYCEEKIKEVTKSRQERSQEEELILNILHSPDDFLISREEYLENARFAAISTYAVVVDGKWYERGRMGSFGMSYDEMDPKQWRQFFLEKINEAPEDALFTIVDCHI